MRWCLSAGLTEGAADEELISFDAESSSVSIEEEN
jgi:hypothetical protein